MFPGLGDVLSTASVDPDTVVASVSNEDVASTVYGHSCMSERHS